MCKISAYQGDRRGAKQPHELSRRRTPPRAFLHVYEPTKHHRRREGEVTKNKKGGRGKGRLLRQLGSRSGVLGLAEFKRGTGLLGNMDKRQLLVPGKTGESDIMISQQLAMRGIITTLTVPSFGESRTHSWSQQLGQLSV